MNPKAVLGLIFGILLNSALAGSFSQVYVQNSGSDPAGFITYGTPSAAVYTDTKYAKLSVPPLGSIVSVPAAMTDVIPPCVSPCVISSSNIAPVAPLPVTDNAKIITYGAPNLPVVVAPSKDNGYEYSYVVYDENTGDQKAQHESSDGSVVRGEYSFIQPDGYTREVKYTADDLSGIPPSPDHGGEKKAHPKTKSEPKPCVDPKKEALKVKPEHLKDTLEFNEVNAEPTTAATLPSKDKAESVHVTTSEATHAPHETHVPEHSETPSHPKSEAAPGEIQATVKEITEAPTPSLSIPNFLVSYNDIIRCIQSSIQTQGSLKSGLSPLTYIILPGKPC
ncbi:hypothetical protein evm_002824 [Chilo suppressalis]|nr:hypothetical protein evm_002824 [Chilo suppressalis]